MKELSKFFISDSNKIIRFFWSTVWLLLYRPSPILFHRWRRWLLMLFGAKLHPTVHLYPSSVIWAPWNLVMRQNSCLSHNVICYNVAQIKIGSNVTVSQFSHLCTATHDYTELSMSLLIAPIIIEDYAWITADVFVGPGVTIGEGAVINARSSVFSDIAPWTVAKGNPACSYKGRILRGIHE